MIITLNNLGNILAKTFERSVFQTNVFSKVLGEQIYAEAYLNFMLYTCGTGFSQ